MNTLSQLLFTNWDFMRIVRLFIGLYAAYQSVILHDTMLGFLSAFFLFQAVTNTGCCGTQACAAPPSKTNTSKTEEVEYEEIK